MMDVVEDIVIVGAGVAGLTTSLGLRRLGIGSIVLESSDNLRTTGYALGIWSNGWKALDAVGIGDSLRKHHLSLSGVVTTSTVSGLQTANGSFTDRGKNGDPELRCVRRNLLLESLANDLPNNTIRFSSKVVSIEESGYFKLLHLADGSIIRTKVLIGCDGVNSVVAKFLRLKTPVFTGRSAVRGCLTFQTRHDLEPKMMQFFGQGVRSGAIPCGDHTIYWFFTWTPSNQEKETVENPARLKELVLSKLGKMPEKIKAVIEHTEQECFTPAPLRYRHPWELLWGNISKGNVTVAGDALHPMTPDIAQGGCSALEDGIVLARCLGEAFLKKPSGKMEEADEREQYERIEMGLSKYANERRWRSFELISIAYTVGLIQQSNGLFLNFLRDKVLASFLVNFLRKRAAFDCGKLSSS